MPFDPEKYEARAEGRREVNVRAVVRYRLCAKKAYDYRNHGPDEEVVPGLKRSDAQAFIAIVIDCKPGFQPWNVLMADPVFAAYVQKCGAKARTGKKRGPKKKVKDES